MYSTGTGTFTSKDSQLFISSMNAYSYCNNSPLNYIDPSGNDVEVIEFEDSLQIILRLEIAWTNNGINDKPVPVKSDTKNTLIAAESAIIQSFNSNWRNIDVKYAGSFGFSFTGNFIENPSISHEPRSIKTHLPNSNKDFGKPVYFKLETALSSITERTQNMFPYPNNQVFVQPFFSDDEKKVTNDAFSRTLGSYVSNKKVWHLKSEIKGYDDRILTHEMGHLMGLDDDYVIDRNVTRKIVTEYDQSYKIVTRQAIGIMTADGDKTITPRHISTILRGCKKYYKNINARNPEND